MPKLTLKESDESQAGWGRRRRKPDGHSTKKVKDANKKIGKKTSAGVASSMVKPTTTKKHEKATQQENKKLKESDESQAGWGRRRRKPDGHSTKKVKDANKKIGKKTSAGVASSMVKPT